MLLVSRTSVPAGPPLVIAHRGASGALPENSLPAFRAAWAAGADGVESDLRLTSDGVVVCMHDPGSGRVSPERLRIAETPFADLQRVVLRGAAALDPAELQIPTLSDLLGTAPDRGMLYLEIKSGVETLRPVRDELAAAGFPAGRLRLLSFNALVIREAETLLPGAERVLLVELTRNVQRREWLPRRGHLLSRLRASHADALEVQFCAGVNCVLVKTMARAGYAVHVWGVNDRAAAERCRSLGVVSITTDWPSRLTPWLPADTLP